MTAENRRFLLPPIINRILTLLTEQGFAAYVVGGAVRDLLLGKTPGDFDVATSARPESVISILEPAGFTVVGELGQNFGVVVVHRDSQMVEIATFRGEAYGGDAHKPAQVWYCDDLEADLSRRDFTVNAWLWISPVMYTIITAAGRTCSRKYCVLSVMRQPVIRKMLCVCTEPAAL